MPLLGFFQWLEQTSVSVAIRESTLMFPIIEGTHVLGLAFSVGIIMLIDLRLVGLSMRQTPVSVLFQRIQPWSLGGFVVMFVTGALLFWSEPVKCATTTSFVLKMIAIAVLGVNMLVFHLGIYKSIANWDNGSKIPGAAKFAGAVSLVLWTFVISAGRWTAYF
jgi:hypothetical protein